MRLARKMLSENHTGVGIQDSHIMLYAGVHIFTRSAEAPVYATALMRSLRRFTASRLAQ